MCIIHTPKLKSVWFQANEEKKKYETMQENEKYPER